MLYLLVRSLEFWLKEQDLWKFVNFLTYEEFRAVSALIVSFFFVLMLGPRVIRWLVRQKIGDAPEFHNADVNQLMRAKANTPTMGGILIGAAILFATLLLAKLTSFYVQMALLCLLWLACLGAVDDWLKLTNARRAAGSRHGLYTFEKLLFQVGLAVLLGIFIHHWGVNKYLADFNEMSRMSHALTLPFLKTWDNVGTQLEPRYVPSEHLITLGAGAFVVLTVMVIVGASNAVNLTDGMDGLAGGITCIVALALMILTLIAGQERWAKSLLVPYIPESGELAILAGAMVGSCLGFLWYNCNPAQVFMGDTGSLALGGLMGYIAVVIRQEFLLLVIGGIFVLEAVSVILQVGYFKATGGRRIFRMAPIHHHFHLKGWGEQQVVMRFWIISAVLAALALATIRLR